MDGHLDEPIPAAPTDGEARAVAAIDASGLRYRLVRHGPVRSLAEAAVARHLRPDQVIKTIVALEVTGYERGTITPFGALRAWPVVADARVPGRAVSIGAGAHGVSASVDGSRLVLVLGATVADVTDDAPER